MPLTFKCIFCKKSMPIGSQQAHALDPCALVIVGHADKEWQVQKEQTFNCHFECFRRLVGDDGLLYIKDADFSTNAEIEAELAKEPDIQE